MIIPRQCPTCNLRNFRETNKKITCQLCGWFMWKNPNRQKASSGRINANRTPKHTFKGQTTPTKVNSEGGSIYFQRNKPLNPDKLKKEYEK